MFAISNNHNGYHLKTNIETEGDLGVLVTVRRDLGTKVLKVTLVTNMTNTLVRTLTKDIIVTYSYYRGEMMMLLSSFSS